jgi:epoxyqueuosine reductase
VIDRGALRDEILNHAAEQGWAAAGVASVRPFREPRRRALAAIAEGRMDGMSWFSADRVDAAADLRRRYPWARTVLSLAWPYRPAFPLRAGNMEPPAAEAGRPRGRFAAYACTPETEDGDAVDYHDLLARKCEELMGWISKRVPGVRSKHFIDHGWAMDRPVAERAGIGFAGKNTCVITRTAGSYVLLADLLLSLPLPTSAKSHRGCGYCKQCLVACPTGALIAPGVMDSRRCISYLTIEHKGSIPEELRPLMGTWAFGCDICQEACPINQRLAPAALDAGGASTERGPVPYPDLVECLELSEEEFAKRFRNTALWRTRRNGLARNAAIALGNAGDPSAIPALRRAAAGDADPVVRESARWAIARLGAALT